LESDLGERTNIAASHPEKTAELHRLLKEWRAEVNAPVPTELRPDYNPDAKALSKYKKRKKKK